MDFWNLQAKPHLPIKTFAMCSYTISKIKSNPEIVLLISGLLLKENETTVLFFL